MTLSRRAVSGLGACALAAAVLPRQALAAARSSAAAFDAMVRLDALYIPALSHTSAAQFDPLVAPKAVASQARLKQAWPALLKDLAANPPAASQATAWRRALQRAGRQVGLADAAVARAEWTHAHEALEPVREALMGVRQAAGFEYFVDRLTAYHEPMEQLVLAAQKLKPGAIDDAARQRLAHVYGEARARWRDVEQHPADASAYHLSAARQAQLQQGLSGATAALSRLSDALRGTDDAALLAALKGIKPPFARAFTAFGLADGEASF